MRSDSDVMRNAVHQATKVAHDVIDRNIRGGLSGAEHALAHRVYIARWRSPLTRQSN
jgi:hypothetical protein